MIFGVLALGWRGSMRHWQHYEKAYLILAGLATPLVLSVHSIVSMDFATSQLPGWHTTIFPPYFVAGAIFSGFAMVVTLMVITRKAFGLEHVITMKHFDYMAKIMLVTGMMVGYAYGMEFFIAWYSGNAYELFTFMNRAFGPYAWAYWTMVTCNVLLAAALLVQEGAHVAGLALRALDLRQHRHVVRALRDHRHLAAPRLPALELVHVHADVLGRRDHARQLRPVLHHVLPVRPLPADRRHGRGEDRCCRRPRRTRTRRRGSSTTRRADRPGDRPRAARAEGMPADGAPATQPAARRALRRARRVRDPGGRSTTPARRCATPATRAGTRTRRSRCTGSSARWASSASRLPWIVLVHGARRRGGRHGAPGVGEHDRLPAGDQRQAVLQLAGLRAGHLRAGGARRRARRRASACSPSTSCRRSTIRSSARRASSARATTASSSRSSPGIRSSTPTRPWSCCAALGATHVELVAS